MAKDPRPDLASAMYPALSQSARAREAAQSQEQAQWDRWRAQFQQMQLRSLKEHNARMRADRERSGR